MRTLLVRHKIADYAIWQPVFDEFGFVRQVNGARGGRVFRNAADPDELWHMPEWDDLELAHLYVRSDDLTEALVRAGVSDQPDTWYREEADQP